MLHIEPQDGTEFYFLCEDGEIYGPFNSLQAMEELFKKESEIFLDEDTGESNITILKKISSAVVKKETSVTITQTQTT
jgi:hypothetical protein